MILLILQHENGLQPHLHGDGIQILSDIGDVDARAHHRAGDILNQSIVARLAGNEAMKLYMVMMGMKLPSFPTKGQPD